MEKFKQKFAEYGKTLETFVPIVARVHGTEHPEFLNVKKEYDSLIAKLENADSMAPDLSTEFATLRSITSNYTVPSNTCESYEAVYHMLSELDTAYSH